MPALSEIWIWLVPVVVAITLHEASHAFAAFAFGDDTAKRQGRMSLNPLPHIDAFGTIILPLLLWFFKAPFIIGYARPVPVNFSDLKPWRIGVIVVALAGIAMNLLLLFVGAVAIGFTEGEQMTAMWVAWLQINAILAVFNLIPLPPLDGSRVVMALLPARLGYLYSKLAPLTLVAVLVLLLLPDLLPFDPLQRFVLVPAVALIEFALALTGNLPV